VTGWRERLWLGGEEVGGKVAEVAPMGIAGHAGLREKALHTDAGSCSVRHFVIHRQIFLDGAAVLTKATSAAG
jgi:hypothetical protein